MKQFVFFCIALLFGATASLADVLVMSNGRSVEVDGPLEVKGSFVIFKDMAGELRQLPLSAVNIEKSKTATQALVDKRAAEAALKAAPKAPPKRVGTMEEIVNSVERVSGRRDKAVSISDDGLDKYNQTHQRVINEAAESSTDSAAASTGTKADADPKNPADAKNTETEKNAAPTAAQMADPAYMKQKRQDIKERKGQMDDDVAELDKAIKNAENNRDLSRAAAADGENLEGAGDQDGDENSNPHYDQAEKAEKQVEELKKKRAEKSKEMGSLKKEAKQAGVKYDTRTTESTTGLKKRKDDDANANSTDSKYREDGKRKSLHNEDTRKNRKEKDEANNSKYDKDGKRKRLNN